MVHRSNLAYVGVEFQESKAGKDRAELVAQVGRCVEINQCVGCRRRVDGVEVDAAIQDERAVKFEFHTVGSLERCRGRS